MPEANTRQHIIEAADDLFYRQGYESTSFADIANVVEISRGNFYHHFRSKDEILDAVIAARLGHTHAMLEQWEHAGRSPPDRIRLFIEILLRNRDSILQHGCPVGTLTMELAKLRHPSQSAATTVFTLFRTWLRTQFERLGADAPDALAMHLLARTQGVAVLANAFADPAFVQHEVEQLCAWLEACATPPKRVRGKGKDKGT